MKVLKTVFCTLMFPFVILGAMMLPQLVIGVCLLMILFAPVWIPMAAGILTLINMFSRR